MLKISDYEFLDALYHYKSITQTANALFISQPALTKRLRQIEEDLNTVIVYRNVKGVHFTPEGEFVVQYAQKCIKDNKELRRELHGIQQRNENTIRIASASSLAYELLPALFQKFKQVSPETHIILHAVGSGESAQLVHNGQADIGFVCGEQPWSFERIIIHSVYMTVLYHQPVELKKLPFLSRIDPRFSVNSQRMISNWWQNNFDIPPHISMTVRDIQTCVAMVSRGLGYSILIDETIYHRNPQIYHRILCDNRGDPIKRNDYIVFLPNIEQRSPVKAFIDFCKTYFAELNSSSDSGTPPSVSESR